MTEDDEVIQLKEIYHNMDTDNKKKTVFAAAQLLIAQQTLKNEHLTAGNNTSTKNHRRAGLPIYFVLGLLFFIAIYTFWVTLINPALLTIGSTPIIMLQIILTALGGISFIALGLVRFILYKLTAPWMLLTIGSGVLCVEPGALTDLIGITIITLIIAIHVIQNRKVNAGLTS